MALSKPAKSELQRVSSRIHFFNAIRSSPYLNIKVVGYHRIPIVSALCHSGSVIRHVWLDRQWLSAAETTPMRIPSEDYDYTLAVPFLGTLSAPHVEKGPIIRMGEVKHISKASTKIVF
jgi:hypothetical protein